MGLFERVLIAVPGSSADVDLIRYARAVGGVLGNAEYCFVHVLGWSTHSQFHTQPTTHAQALDRLRENVARHFGAGRVRCVVLNGSVLDCILGHAADFATDLILVSHSGEQGGRRSLTRRLAMQAPCCVWMKPDKAAHSLRRVLAAVDYSEPSAYALSIAGQLARRAGSMDCRALHVQMNDTSAGVGAYQSSNRDAFDRFTAPLDTDAVEVRPLMVEGDNVAQAVHFIAQSDPVDLVVLGSRGQSRSASNLLGSEAENLIMESRVPVLIAKRRAERIGLLQALLDRNLQLQEPSHFG